MATLSRTVLATTFAAAMLAGSSFAFAADNNGGKSGNNNNSVGDAETTGSVNQNDGDSPSMDEKEACTAGMESSPQCADDMKKQ